MISVDQPICFPKTIHAAVSSREDGTVLDRSLENRHNPNIVENRRKICEAIGVNYEDCVYQIISYDEANTFDVIGEVDKPDNVGVHADVLYTETVGVGMFLPIADCVGTVLYDPTRKALALAHLGRHASIAKTITKTIEHFAKKGSDPKDLIMWMSPHVQKHGYILTYFDHLKDTDWQAFVTQENDGIHLDLAGFNKFIAIKSGVLEKNIHVSAVNTATDQNYFSHSSGDVGERFAVVTSMMA